MLLAVVLAALLGCSARTPLDQARQAWIKEALAQVEPVVEEATGTPIRISAITWMLRSRRGVCAAYWYRPGEGQGRIEFYPNTGCDLEGMRLKTLVHELAHAVHGQPAGIGVYGQEAHGEEFEAINATALRAVLREVQLPPWPGAWGLPLPRRPDADPDKLRHVILEERRAELEERARIAAANAQGPAPRVQHAADIPAASPQLIGDTQAALLQLGYNPGIVDGQNGPRTRAAVADFQRDMGLAPTGQVSPELLWRAMEELIRIMEAQPPAYEPAPDR